MSGPLPGLSAQLRMAPTDVSERLHVPERAVPAAVLALLYPHKNRWTVALIRRSRATTPEDRHAGQVAFPGGRMEPNDPDLQYTAVREAEEEVGIAAETLHHLGALSPLYIPVSGYLVHPFLAWTTDRPTFRLQQSEVAGLLEPGLTDLLQPQSVQHRPMRLVSGAILPAVPCYVWEGQVIWGATAMMLSELLWLVNESLNA